MQQIERYGVIALVFFLITIVAVSFWGDSKSPGFWSRLTGRAQKDVTADNILPPASSTDAALTPPGPLDQDPSRNLVVGSPAVTPVAAPIETAPQQPIAQPIAQPLAQPLAQPIAPLAAPAPAVANEYVVQKGDSLAQIARRTLGKESRWTEIAALNPGLTPKSLKVGAKLALPADATQAVAQPTLPAQKKTEPAPKPKSSERVATPERRVAGGPSCKVQKGDTFKAIARRELGDSDRWKEIADLNPGVSASKLAVGQVLRLPAGTRALESATLVADASPASNKPRIR